MEARERRFCPDASTEPRDWGPFLDDVAPSCSKFSRWKHEVESRLHSTRSHVSRIEFRHLSRTPYCYEATTRAVFVLIVVSASRKRKDGRYGPAAWTICRAATGGALHRPSGSRAIGFLRSHTGSQARPLRRSPPLSVPGRSGRPDALTRRSISGAIRKHLR